MGRLYHIALFMLFRQVDEISYFEPLTYRLVAHSFEALRKCMFLTSSLDLYLEVSICPVFSFPSLWTNQSAPWQLHPSFTLLLHLLTHALPLTA